LKRRELTVAAFSLNAVDNRTADDRSSSSDEPHWAALWALDERAEQSTTRLLALSKADAVNLADQLGLSVRFFRHGEALTEEHTYGRVYAELNDDIVVASYAG
jgi:hypothetical protein